MLMVENCPFIFIKLLRILSAKKWERDHPVKFARGGSLADVG